MELKRAVRLDSILLDGAHYTEEGYLVDIPIVTTCGIFEYKNDDGSVRRELRLPEDVFAEDSLASYEGKPVIITHNSGKVDKNNVAKEQIGTIISKGMRDGNNVRAKIVIHDTDQMQRCGFKELSLGYSLDTDDTPGVWQGQPYDCIQRNIEINHLALVREARAGDAARLNIDGKEEEGGKEVEEEKTMQNELSPEELEAAIELYKSHKAAGATNAGAGADGGGEKKEPELAKEPEKGAEPGPAEAGSGAGEGQSPTERIRAHMKKLDEGEGGGNSMEVIRQLKDNIMTLLDECDKLAASKDMGADSLERPSEAPPEDEENKKKENADGKEGFNADAIDAMVSEKLDVCRIAERLDIEGIENMPVMEGRKKVISAVHPKINLDGKSDAYVNAAYDIAKQAVMERRSTDGQWQRIVGADAGRRMDSVERPSAELRREEMIHEMMGGE